MQNVFSFTAINLSYTYNFWWHTLVDHIWWLWVLSICSTVLKFQNALFKSIMESRKVRFCFELWSRLDTNSVVRFLSIWNLRPRSRYVWLERKTVLVPAAKQLFATEQQQTTLKCLPGYLYQYIKNSTEKSTKNIGFNPRSYYIRNGSSCACVLIKFPVQCRFMSNVSVDVLAFVTNLHISTLALPLILPTIFPDVCYLLYLFFLVNLLYLTIPLLHCSPSSVTFFHVLTEHLSSAPSKTCLPIIAWIVDYIKTEHKKLFYRIFQPPKMYKYRFCGRFDFAFFFLLITSRHLLEDNLSSSDKGS